MRLIKNLGEMEKSRAKWLTLSPSNKTWIKFKDHFTTAWDELCLLRGPTMKDTLFYQQANIIKQEVMAAMREEQAAMVQEVKKSNELILAALQTAPEQTTHSIQKDVQKEPTVVSNTSSIT